MADIIDVIQGLYDKYLVPFRGLFSRRAAYNHFVSFISSQLFCGYTGSVTAHVKAFSYVKDYKDLDRSYENMLKFFRADSYRLKELEKMWMSLISQSGYLYKESNKPILIEDGHVSIKSGRHMPATGKLMQASESPSKPQITFGHEWGCLSVLAGNDDKLYALPLQARIHSRDNEIRSWEPKNYKALDVIASTDKDVDVQKEKLEYLTTSVEKAISAAKDASNIFGSCFLLGDRYYFSSKTISTLSIHNNLHPNNTITLISKSRNNCIAYSFPDNSNNKRGRKRKRGDKINLYDCFKDESEFKTTNICLYGEDQEVKYLEKVLLWGKSLYAPLKFVLVSYNNRKSILVSNDTTLAAVDIIKYYEKRWKCEQNFKVMEQIIKGFSSHFFTLCCPKLNRYQKKGDKDPLAEVTNENNRRKIFKTFTAYERYAFFNLIVHGLLQLLSLTLAKLGYKSKFYLRTRRSHVCSEDNIRNDLNFVFLLCITSLARSSIPTKKEKATTSTNKNCLFHP